MISVRRRRDLALEAAEVRRIVRVADCPLVQAALNAVVGLILPAL